MRTGAVIATALMALATISCTSADEPGNAVSANISTVCVEKLRFADDGHRSAFLDRNADRIIRQTATGALYIIPDIDIPTLELASSEAGSCPADGLAAAYGFEGSYHAANRQASAEEVQSQLEQTMGLNLSGTDSDVHRCVVRTDRGGLDEFGLLSRRLWFSGLRRARLEGADGVIYLAAEESCALLRRFALAAMNSLELADPQLVLCGETSFRGCGFPHTFTYDR
jgi:hypothetical protein